MARSTVLALGKAAAERGMVDTCEIKRHTGETTDEYSGEIVDTFDTIYTGKCRLQQGAADAQPQDSGEAYILLQRVELQVPLAAVGIKVDDEVTITAAGRDPDLVSKVFLIRDLHIKTDATSRRFRVEEKTS